VVNLIVSHRTARYLQKCCKLDSTLCIETSKELRTRLAEVAYIEYADQSLTKQLVTCSMDTAYPPIRNKKKYFCENKSIIFSVTSNIYTFFFHRLETILVS
jgi:hypothetical protein